MYAEILCIFTAWHQPLSLHAARIIMEYIHPHILL